MSRSHNRTALIAAVAAVCLTYNVDVPAKTVAKIANVLPPVGLRVSIVTPATGIPLAPAGVYEVTGVADTITLRKLTADKSRHHKTAKPVAVSLAGWPVYVEQGTLKLAA